jgi:replication factor C subunit 1
MAKIIGQADPKSNANKLFNWLKNWNKFNMGNEKVKKPFNDETGMSSKAALLSGPPGIGKTTTA